MSCTTSPRHRSLHRSIALVLACGACSSEPSEVDAVPLYNPGSSAPTPPAAGAPATPPPASVGTVPPVQGAPTPASEVPVTPELMLGAPGSSATGTGAVDAGNGVPGGGNPAAGGAPGVTEPDGTAAAGAAGGGEPSGPLASAMCGRGGGSPSFNLPNTLFSVPSSYDGNTPLPVVIAFHAAGNPNTQLQGILGATLQNDYIVLYPKSDGNGWVDGVDSPKVDAIFNALDAVACYDHNRVFATGHSSGAQFIVQRLCAGETRWRAVATVSSSVYCSSWQPIPALVIHGIGDTERQMYGLDDGDGLKDIVPYRTSNGCQQTYTDVPVDGCTSSGVAVVPGCRDFDGCGETTRWCQHNDPQYGTSHHGVPCFGARTIKQFFDGYR